MKTKLLLAAICLAMSLTGCEVAKEIIEGEEAPLKEADLPNCSKVINCCNNGLIQGLSEDVDMACADQLVPASSTVIDNYQAAQAELEPGSAASEELRATTQGSAEAGCRCFLEQTIGTLDVPIPLDCQSDTSVGSVEADMCDGAVDELVNGAGNEDG